MENLKVQVEDRLSRRKSIYAVAKTQHQFDGTKSINQSTFLLSNISNNVDLNVKVVAVTSYQQNRQY